MLDDRAPHPYLGAGFPRAHDILRLLDAQGHELVFIPCVVRESAGQLGGAIPARFQYITMDRAADVARYVETNANNFDVLWVSRPNNMAMLQWHLPPGHPMWETVPLVVYDAEAIFSLRNALQKDYHPVESPWMSLDEELELARVADVVAVVSSTENHYFRQKGLKTAVLGGCYGLAPELPHFDQTRGFLFVGAMRGHGTPNVDALDWFCKLVVPILRSKLGDAFQLEIAGLIEGESPEYLAAPDIRFLGMVPDLHPVYARSRVLVAPHRFAAGIAAKILEASAHGVPVVATRLLSGQLNWRHGREVFAADTNNPDAFAEVCIEAYQDVRIWQQVQEGARNCVARDYSEAAFGKTLGNILETTCE